MWVTWHIVNRQPIPWSMLPEKVIKSWKKNFVWATESEKYIILTLFYDQNYVNLSNLNLFLSTHNWTYTTLVSCIHYVSIPLPFSQFHWTQWIRGRYTSSWAGFELTTLVVIDTGCIGSCKSNYHKVTTTILSSCKRHVLKYINIISYKLFRWYIMLYMHSILRHIMMTPSQPV
jgi:hypothetical protein